MPAQPKEVLVSRFMMRFLCVVAFLFAQVATAQDFSADVISTKGNSPTGQGKLFYTKNKARWEISDRSNSQMGPTALIVDQGQGKSIVLLPQRRVYMDSMPWMNKTPAVALFWHVDDVDNACPQWKSAAEQVKTDKNWGSCTKVGSDTVNGRSTIKYEGVSDKGEKGNVWVDTKLHCVIKADNTSGGFELRNIQEGSQPASLFEIPAGFTKFDMGNMMQQRPQ
jgi:hypothetical protein